MSKYEFNAYPDIRLLVGGVSEYQSIRLNNLLFFDLF